MAIHCNSIDLEFLFNARPERLYVIKNGQIVFKGGEGPRHYSVDKMQTFLDMELRKNK